MNFLAAAGTPDAALVRTALSDDTLVLPPPVLAEALSSPRRGEQIAADLLTLGRLPLLPGYWERAARSRRLVLAQGLKARTLDALIAQCCIDANVELIAADTDFRHFEAFCGLRLRR